MKSVIILLLLIIHLPAYSQDWMDDKEDLKGQVKSVHYKSVCFFGENPEDWWIQDEKMSYNSNGFLTSRAQSQVIDGTQSSGIYRTYDETGNRCLIEYEFYEGDTSDQYVFEYDKLKRLQKATLTRDGELINVFNYVYNEAGFLREYYVVLDRDNDTSRHIYGYDEKGRRIRSVDKSSHFEQIKTWSFDEDGNVIEKKSELVKSPGTLIYRMNNDGTGKKWRN